MADTRPVKAAKRGVYKGLAAIAAKALEEVLGELPVIPDLLKTIAEFLIAGIVTGPSVETAATWTASIFIGIIAGDAVAVLRGETPPVGPTVGVVRGLGAAVGGLLSIASETVAFAPLAVFLGMVVGEIVGDLTDWVLTGMLG